MEFIEITADIREEFGKGPSGRLRREGKVPAVCYGRDAAPIHLSLDARNLGKVLRDGYSQVLKLHVQGGAETAKTVMFKEVQTHPVSMDLVHIDLYEVSMDRKITVNVPVHTFVAEGEEESRGEAEGGTLQIIRRELEISCLPNQIPDAIEIDITNLGIGDAVHIDEIELPEGVEVDWDVNFTVVSIAAPMREEVVEEEEALEGEEGEEGEGPEEGQGGEGTEEGEEG